MRVEEEQEKLLSISICSTLSLLSAWHDDEDKPSSFVVEPYNDLHAGPSP
jgi:hypothetical protein